MSLDYSDLDPLLAPATNAAPCGPNLEYDRRFLAIEHEFRVRGTSLRESADVLPPDWHTVAAVVENLLRESKDLRIAIYLLRVLVITEGLHGLARGLYLLNRLVQDYWRCLHPELENGDPTWRLNGLAALSDATGLIADIHSTEIARNRAHGRLTVRDVVHRQRTVIEAADEGTCEAILREANLEPLDTAVNESAHWLEQLRERLATAVGESGESATTPLRGLNDLLAALHAWCRAFSRSRAGAGSGDFDGVAASAGVQGAPTGTRFTVYRPLVVSPRVWASFLVYLHSGSAAAVHADSLRRLSASPMSYANDEDARPVEIAHGAEITVVPTLAGCRFNPRRQTLSWFEELHTVEFRFQASPEIAGYTTEHALYGHVRVYVGPLLVAEIPTTVQVADNIDVSESVATETPAVQPFSRVFVSYSHDDSRIVALLERAYELVRIDYLRDVTILRAGDRWGSRLLEEIDRADRFQLCWSAAASRSQYVEAEWRRALSIERTKSTTFICPFYWQRPMPSPPAELAHLHFAYFDWGEV